MKKYQMELTVSSKTMIADDAFLLELTSAETLPSVIPGQFAEFQTVGTNATFLRRPISIHDIDRNNNLIKFLIRIVGNGTESLSKLLSDDIVNVILPLGNGFEFDAAHTNHPLLVGGGVGIAPLMLLGREMMANGIGPTFLFGGKSKNNLLRIKEFSEIGEVFCTTEDGTFGQTGFVTGHTVLKDKNFDAIYACGPTPMMKAVARLAIQNNVCCQVSLEHKMACGIGACLCCVENTKEGNLCVCKDGPVFDINRLLWQI